MGFGVLGGAVLTCSFGMAPSTFNVLPTARVMSSMPVGCIMDHIPMVNIMPFGMCQSLANPTVASATAAAFGVLMGGKPALNNSCKLMCAYGGVIQISSPGTANIQVK